MDILDYILENHKHKVNRSSTEIYDMGRNDLARLFGQFGFDFGVEIGTERGRFASVLLRENLGLMLTTVDPYKYYDEGEGYRSDVGDPGHIKNRWKRTKIEIELGLGFLSKNDTK